MRGCTANSPSPEWIDVEPEAGGVFGPAVKPHAQKGGCNSADAIGLCLSPEGLDRLKAERTIASVPLPHQSPLPLHHGPRRVEYGLDQAGDRITLQEVQQLRPEQRAAGP